MRKALIALLQRLGLMRSFDVNDIINAAMEDKAREHEGLVEKLHETFRKQVKTNEALRKSIKVASRRSNAFAEFERLGRRE